jgi:hypothetical protein
MELVDCFYCEKNGLNTNKKIDEGEWNQDTCDICKADSLCVECSKTCYICYKTICPSCRNDCPNCHNWICDECYPKHIEKCCKLEEKYVKLKKIINKSNLPEAIKQFLLQKVAEEDMLDLGNGELSDSELCSNWNATSSKDSREGRYLGS